MPLLIGLIGPSGGGKTYSALRLATGIQTIAGGDIFVLDTEARRALHYADRFRYRHVPFEAPFGPLDYLAAIEHCVSRGATTIVIDSMSHEHEGPGGVLEMHSAEVRRMSGSDPKKAEKVKLLAWAKPKQERQQLIARIVQLGINLICCFRAKEKFKPVGGQVQQLGWMPIAGPEFVYEMTVSALLLPNANGVPTWQPEHDGERQMVKMPGFARDMFQGQITEETGCNLAAWATGAPSGTDQWLARFAACTTEKQLEELDAEIRPIYRTLDGATQQAVNQARRDAMERI